MTTRSNRTSKRELSMPSYGVNRTRLRFTVAVVFRAPGVIGIVYDEAWQMAIMSGHTSYLELRVCLVQL